MDQRMPTLYRSFRNSEYNTKSISRARKILVSDHAEIKYCQEGVIREHFNCCHLAYIASNQPGVIGRWSTARDVWIIMICMVICHQRASDVQLLGSMVQPERG